jgi:hypothetical protein
MVMGLGKWSKGTDLEDRGRAVVVRGRAMRVTERVIAFILSDGSRLGAADEVNWVAR